MAEKYTIFQQLESLFGPERKKEEAKSRYSLGDEQILKTQSKEEYDTAKLEAQQSKYLSNMWHKVDNEIYQQSVFYETTRIASYSDFEGMEFFPEIAAALDIMMEESTTQNGEGRILNIFSESKRVRRILQDLFFNKLDVHTNLAMWTRNTCKYGDNFLFLDIDPKEGIRDVKQLPNIEIERREGDFIGQYHAGNIDSGEDKDDGKVSYFWRGKDVTFNSWQMAHFRLLGDDRRLPYGTSMLEKARRIWKQLLLSEDAMLIYRVTRAPERRIFKIYVGNIDEQDVAQYVQKIANNFKRSPVIDENTGQIDTKYNQMAQDQDYFIPVRDPSAPSPIETLPGATNLSEIADIEFLQKKLFTALRVPKPFLGFEETNGDGKNLALQDIRFTRTVNRIQQAMIQELNKIAIIHLYVLGLEDDLDNFTLSLNNPSTQADMLRTEQLQQKIQVYRDSVADAGNGFAAMSMTRAKKEILGMSEEDIRVDLEQQRMEKAAAAEMEQTSNIIKKTGVFDRVDALYGEFGGSTSEGATEGGAEGGDEFAAGGGGGGGFGGGLEGGDEFADDGLGGEEGSLGTEEPSVGGEELSAEPSAEPAAEIPMESHNKKGDLLVETEMRKRKLDIRTKKYQNIFTNRLIESLDRKGMIQPMEHIEKSKDSLTEDLKKMSDNIDELTKD
tara:strand:- start:4062 stop:6074 length:2013 start_codon:yes stop_codon:yes gene_type:complete